MAPRPINDDTLRALSLSFSDAVRNLEWCPAAFGLFAHSREIVKHELSPDAVNLLKQLCQWRPVRRILASMGEEDISATIDQEVAAALIIVLFAVTPDALALAQESEIQAQRRKRKDAP